MLITGFGGKAEGLRESEGECGHKHVLPLLNGGKNGSTYKWNPTGTQGGELSGCLGYISTVRPPTQVVSPKNPPPKSSSKRLVTAKFTGVTSTVSLTSNSPVYSGYSCYQHLIIVLCEVPLVLLPFDSASFTHADSGDRNQKNHAPAAGQEMPAVLLTET